MREYTVKHGDNVTQCPLKQLMVKQHFSHFLSMFLFSNSPKLIESAFLSFQGIFSVEKEYLQEVSFRKVLCK